MSKIEIVSKFGNVGDVVLSVKGEPVTVTFKAVRGGASVAEVDEDVAEVLLGQLGHEYSKPGAIVVESEPKAKDPEKKDGDDTLTLETYAGVNNAMQLKSKLNKVTDAALVMELVAAETQGKNREGFVKLLNDRLEELKA